MKKQTKKTKLPKQQKTKMVVAINQAVVAHSRWQRFWGVIALAGLFFCGLFVGLAVNNPSKQMVTSENVIAQPVAEPIAEPVDVCADIERLLARHLPNATDNVDDRIERARIFATMSERGCPENSATYVELASQELDIARAIEDDDFNHAETIDVVEIYKRIHMQAAAEEIFEKVKKLTSPTIDFIIQVEKIINE